MVIRRVSTRIYFIAGLLTLLVLASGLLVGFFIADLRVASLEQRYRKQVKGFENIRSHGLESAKFHFAERCAVTERNLRWDVESVNIGREKVEKYVSSLFAGYNTQLTKLGREYALIALRYWLLSLEIWQICQIAEAPLLYLYSGRGCDDCLFQHEAVTVVREKHGQRSVVFAVDSDLLREEEIKTIRKSHSVTTGPPLIIVGSRDSGLFRNLEESLRRVNKHDGPGLR